MLLKDLPADARPREKLLALGPAALADAELVALLLRTGLPGLSVLQLAQQTLDAFGGLTGLLNASGNDLKRIKGLGPAKRAEVAAVGLQARRSRASSSRRRSSTARPGSRSICSCRSAPARTRCSWCCSWMRSRA